MKSIEFAHNSEVQDFIRFVFDKLHIPGDTPEIEYAQQKEGPAIAGQRRSRNGDVHPALQERRRRQRHQSLPNLPEDRRLVP